MPNTHESRIGKLEDDYNNRISRLEENHGAIMTHLEALSGSVLSQAKASTRIAEQMETFVKDALDSRNGIVPQGAMRIEDHKSQMRFLIYALGTVLSFVMATALFVSRISVTEEGKQAIAAVTRQATTVIHEVAEDVKK